MATRITMTIPKDLSEQEQHDLRLLLQDAFHEFSTKRYPAKAYVENRYPDLSNEERKAKTEQVDRRAALGKAMHQAAFDAKMERVFGWTNHAVCVDEPCGPRCMGPAARPR